jgi:transcriptional regulator with XRE-family HTH domain
MTLNAARGLLNWTQEDLARETGISVSTINRIEAQKNSPSIDRCAAIVSALKRGGLVGLSLDSIAWSSTNNARSSAAASR